MQRAVDAAIAEFGRIDILINNAGIVAYAEVDTMTDAEWDAMIGINLTGPFVVTRAVVPHLKAAGRGVIVNNSSVMGLRGGNRLSHYVASKHGLTGLTKAWAIELAPHGIRVVSIHPTGVDTPMNDGLAAMEGATPQEIAERSAGNLLAGRAVDRDLGCRRAGALPGQRSGALRDGRAVRPRRRTADSLTHCPFWHAAARVRHLHPSTSRA